MLFNIFMFILQNLTPPIASFWFVAELCDMDDSDKTYCKKQNRNDGVCIYFNEPFRYKNVNVCNNETFI